MWDIAKRKKNVGILKHKNKLILTSTIILFSVTTVEMLVSIPINLYLIFFNSINRNEYIQSNWSKYF
jgi:hypothetical protein